VLSLSRSIVGTNCRLESALVPTARTSPRSKQSSYIVSNPSCLFCKVVSGELAARKVFEDDNCIAFLDHRPVFPGHSLLIPKQHYETLADLPHNLIEPFFANAQMLARAIESALEAHGSFVAMNNRVSQSVPHFHVHIVPRRRKDGLRGFFWPRYPYKSDEDAETVQQAIRKAVIKLQNPER